MTTTNSPEAQQQCPECGSLQGHKLSCVTGNKQAAKYQHSLERQHAIKQLEEIRACDKCDLCEDHHD
jgi:hypothetical protein